MVRYFPISSSSGSQRWPANVVLQCLFGAGAATKCCSASLHAVALVQAADGEGTIPRKPEAISLILRGSGDSEMPGTAELSSHIKQDSPNSNLDMRWLSDSTPSATVQWRKDILRERKKKYALKNTESRRFTGLIKACSDKLGIDATLEFFGKLGRDTDIKEYNTFIRVCIGRAKSRKSEVSAKQIHKIYMLFQSMRERGFQIEEETYGPFFKFLVDMKMVEDFQIFRAFLEDCNPQARIRIGYYEMLLCIQTGDEVKISELCESLHSKDEYNLAECYFLAFYESDREKDLVMLFDVLDIRKVSKAEHRSLMFKSLGRLKLVNIAQKFLLQLSADESFSSFIYDYATNIPNLEVEEVAEAFFSLHQNYKVSPSIEAYEQLITLCCNMFKVDAALQVIDHMSRSHNDVPIELFHPILFACEQKFEFNMVHKIYDVMRQHNVKPNEDTFRSMMSMCVKMKDYQAAYNMLQDVIEIGEIPSVRLYNTIMAGYFREKNIGGALMFLKHMKKAGVLPDSETFVYLISNSVSEQDIAKYLDEMRQLGVQLTKYIYMALVNSYAKFGNFEMSKKVLQDPDMPSKHLIDVKSSFAASLALNGAISDAFEVYEEIKKDGCSLEPKSTITVIDNTQDEGRLGSLLQLLEDLKDSALWIDGCRKVILYSVQHNHANAAINLLQQLKDKDERSANWVVDQIFHLIWSNEPVNLQLGMEILDAVKEEPGLVVSRTSLDFLLSSCARVKDSASAWQIWKEYESASLPYNVLSYLRMYQALLASGEREAAKPMLREIRTDDVHVNYVIRSCKSAYRLVG